MVYGRGSISSLTWGSIVSIAICSSAAQAAESIAPAGPIGGTDIRSGILPPPGLYGVGVGVGIGLPGWQTASDTLPSSGDVMIGGLGLMYVYDTKVLGASLASSIYAGYERVCFGLKPSTPQCSTGLTDAYSDLFMLNWFFPNTDPSNKQAGVMPIPYGLSVLVGLGMNLPSGVYSDQRPINVGSNFYDIAPNIGVTYTTKSLLGPVFGQATEFSARAFYNVYTENVATQYQTGQLFSMDFAITQRLNQWQYGLAGTGYVQVQDDTVRGVTVPPDGHRARYLGLGPLLAYDFIADGRPWNATLKGLFFVTGTNVTVSEGFVLRVATKF